MKKLNQFVLSCVVAGMCSAAIAQDADAPRPPRPQGGPGMGMPMNEQFVKRAANNVKNLIKNYDADQDGKLNDAERAKLEADYNLQELQEEQQAINQKLQKARQYAIFKIVDKNGDGELDNDEIAAAPETIKEYMAANPEAAQLFFRPGMGGGRGGQGMGGGRGPGMGGNKQGGPRGPKGGKGGKGPRGPKGGDRPQVHPEEVD